MAFPLTQEQLDIVRDRGGELLVSASAGSGKTRVLVERLLNRVTEEKIDIDRFLIITFTKAAAAELRSRIAQELSVRLAQKPNDKHLRRQTTLLYRTQISTIHSFCSMLLREHGHVLDLDRDVRLCEEGEAQILMVQTLDQLLERRYEGLAPDTPFAKLVDAMAAGRDDSRLTQIVLDIYGRIQSHPSPKQWLYQQKECWSFDAVDDMSQTVWGKLLLSDSKRQLVRYRRQLDRARELSGQDELLLLNYEPTLEATIRNMDAFLSAEKWDEAVACMPIPFPAAGRKRKRTIELTSQEELERGVIANTVKRIRDQVKKHLEKVAQWFEEDSAGHIEAMAQVQPSVHALLDLVLDFQAAYETEKRRRNVVDFSDLEHLAVALLLDKHGKPTQLAEYCAKQYVEVMVDEYQDTNQVQNAIFSAVSRGGQTLFEVGDVKQSIYRFRLADPTIFLDKYQRFAMGDQAGAHEPRKRILSRNFRSRPQVLLGCNDLFRAVMSQEFGELDYSEDQALVPGADFPDDTGYELELDLLDLSFLGDQEGEKENKDLLEARFAARSIRKLLDRPLMVTEKETSRPLRPSDVMILLRSPGPQMRHYVRALEEEGIAWNAESAKDLFETTEVNVALAMLQIVDNPRQDVALIAALRSPVYGFMADELAVIRADGEGDFYDALVKAAERGNRRCADFLEELQTLRFGAGDKTCRQLIWHIYESSNLLGIFGAMEHGRERQENLLALYALAGDLEEKGCRTLFSFLLRLEQLRENGVKLKAPELGAAGAGVSILSIHRSKGLEKPVVLLCGLSRRFNTDDLKRPVLFHPVLGVGPKGLDEQRMIEYPLLARWAVARKLEQEMMAEELRLLYVAMTRAKEKLIMTMGLTDGLNHMERFREDLDSPISPVVLESQSSVGDWILLHALTRPEAAALRATAGLPDVETKVLGPAWKINWVQGVPLASGRVHEGHFTDVVQADEVCVETLKEHLRWKYPYEQCVDIPSKRTATQLKGRILDQESADAAGDCRMEPKDVPLAHPNFIAEQLGLTPAQRGTAFHLALQHISLDGDHSVPGIQAELDRMVAEEYLTPVQRDAVSPYRLSAFLTSPLGKDMVAANECHREYKFSLLIPAEEYAPSAEGEEILLQGVVDAWFDDGDGITIVDFKSDRVAAGEEPAKAEEYRPQLEAYRNALSIVMERPVRRCALWFLATGEAVYL